MDRQLARREILLLAANRWTMLWEVPVRLNELAPARSATELIDVAIGVLRDLIDRGSLKFVRAELPGPTPVDERHRLGRAQVRAALAELGELDAATWRTLWIATTRSGDRELAGILGVNLADRRRKAFARVVAGFAAAVQDMVWRRRRRGEDDPGGSVGRWSPPDDDAGLAGSGVPRRPADRSGSGAAIATPEPDYDFERLQPPGT